MNDRQPPSMVPTLTEVVQSFGHDDLPIASPGVDTALAARVTRRVMDGLSYQLEMQLRERVAQIALEHTRDLAPRLQGEIERLVRELVQDAIASERQG